MAEPSASNFVNGANLDDDTTLGGDQVDITSFTLGSNASDVDTTITANATISGVNTPFYLLADGELIYVEGISGADFTPVTRGAGGTTATSHLAGITLYVVYAANLFNQLKRAIIAIEEEVGARTALADGHLDFASATELTIASGSITPTQNWHTVDTQSDAGTDDLDTIVATSLTEGFVLIIRANNDARTVVVKHNTGNILCANGSDINLDDQRDLCVLVYDAALSKWLAGTFSIPPTSSDFLSTLTNSEISITGAGSATISRMHVCTGTSYTVTLPAVSGNVGKFIGFRFSQSGKVTLDGNSAELIDNVLTRDFYPNQSVILYCDGAAWYQVGAVTAPLTQIFFHDQFICSTAETKSAAASQRYQSWAFQTTPADAQNWTIGLWLTKGSYTCTALAETDSAAPKLDWTLDGTSQTTGQDWYSASPVNNVEKSFTLTVLYTGYHVLKATVNGKNASSSNYYWTHTAIYIKPSAY